MFRSDVLEYIIRTYADHDGNIRAAWGKYSLAEYGNTILEQFGIAHTGNSLHAQLHRTTATGKAKQILTIAADSLGLALFQQYGDLELHRKLLGKGVVMPITAGSFSSTPNGMTIIHTNKMPIEHASLEYWMEYDEVSSRGAHLPAQVPGKQHGSLVELSGGSPAMIYSGETLYTQLKRGGVKSYVFMPNYYHTSVNIQQTTKDAIVVPYEGFDLGDMIEQVRRVLEAETEAAYFCAYSPNIDADAHHHGMDSLQHAGAVRSLSDHLMRLSLNLDPEAIQDVTLVVTADHGMVPLTHEMITYLSTDRNIRKALRRRPDGSIVLPGGSPRGLILYTQEGSVEGSRGLYEYLHNKYGQRATILRTQEAVDNGFFGTANVTAEQRAKVIGRAGGKEGILLLPKRNNEGFWYRGHGADRFTMNAMHGGISPQEMLIHFSYIPIADLRDN